MTPQDLSDLRWRKSSRSGGSSSNCVEVTSIPWRKSSRSGDSGDSGDNCVEAASVQGRIAVRDSKHPDDAVLTFHRAAWRALTAGLKGGHLTPTT